MMTVRPVVLITLLAAAACAPPESDQRDDTAVREAVTSALDEHGAASMRQDVAAAADMFTADARIMLPATADIIGRDSIANVMRQFWPQVRPVDIRFDTQEVYAFGNMAVSVGTYDFLLEPKGQTQIRDRGRFMLLWKRDEAGSWRVYRDLTNSELAAPVPVAR